MLHALLIVTAVAAFHGPTPQGFSNNAPRVSVTLPNTIPSELVQISYHMIGPFGGYGGYTEPREKLNSYEIEAMAEGQPASEMKLLVYASGCQIQTYDLPLQSGDHINQPFVCNPLPIVTLLGQIEPATAAQRQNVEVIVDYLAFWANDYFGIYDGAVCQIRVASARPDSSGTFQVELPDFSADTKHHLRVGESDALIIVLRDSKTWNSIANLQPQLSEFRFGANMRIRPSYPPGMKFQASPAR